ncbi:hypothetical protein PoB_005610400 [Plakobranchus ocellatus]|uniref:Uncharacterized protein n=1 Tax=Plakobranchus ocellatus TaxID=259542 RepID=A0AAV4CAL0_9GAST|nr:hypothetical protein PoB_005610400 [Plakobranchus ocellatus]
MEKPTVTEWVPCLREVRPVWEERWIRKTNKRAQRGLVRLSLVSAMERLRIFLIDTYLSIRELATIQKADGDDGSGSGNVSGIGSGDCNANGDGIGDDDVNGRCNGSDDASSNGGGYGNGSSVDGENNGDSVGDGCDSVIGKNKVGLTPSPSIGSPG